jgi:hypothetical protein
MATLWELAQQFFYYAAWVAIAAALITGVFTIDPTFVGMPAYALVLNMLAIGASVKNIFFVFIFIFIQRPEKKATLVFYGQALQ